MQNARVDSPPTTARTFPRAVSNPSRGRKQPGAPTWSAVGEGRGDKSRKQSPPSTTSRAASPPPAVTRPSRRRHPADHGSTLYRDGNRGGRRGRSPAVLGTGGGRSGGAAGAGHRGGPAGGAPVSLRRWAGAR